MADEYTPTTWDVENCYVYAGPNPDGSLVSPERVLRAEFTRWLAAHDREVAAKALRGAASHVDGFAERLRGVIPLEDPGADQRSRAYSQAAGYLRREADRIERGASDGEQ